MYQGLIHSGHYMYILLDYVVIHKWQVVYMLSCLWALSWGAFQKAVAKHMFIFIVIVLVFGIWFFFIFLLTWWCCLASFCFQFFFLFCLGLLLIQTKRSHVSVQIFFQGHIFWFVLLLSHSHDIFLINLMYFRNLNAVVIRY